MKKFSGIAVIVFILFAFSAAYGIGPNSKVYYSFYEPDISEISDAIGGDVNLAQKFNVGMQLELGLPKGFSIVGSGSVYLGKGSSTIEEDMGILGVLSFPLNHEVWIFPVDLMLKYKFYEVSMVSFYGMGGWSWAYSLYRLEYGGTYATLVSGGLNSFIARGWTNSGFVMGVGAEFKVAIISGFFEIVSRNGRIDSLRFFDTGVSELDGQLLTDEYGNNAGIDLQGIEYRIGVSFGF